MAEPRNMTTTIAAARGSDPRALLINELHEKSGEAIPRSSIEKIVVLLEQRRDPLADELLPQAPLGPLVQAMGDWEIPLRCGADATSGGSFKLGQDTAADMVRYVQSVGYRIVRGA